jgi:hypothetical protein
MNAAAPVRECEVTMPPDPLSNTQSKGIKGKLSNSEDVQLYVLDITQGRCVSRSSPVRPELPSSPAPNEFPAARTRSPERQTS